MKYQTRTTRMTVAPEGEAIFSEKATHIEIDDEAAGEFVKVSQCNGFGSKGQTVAFDADEWSHVRHAVDFMVASLREER